MWGETDGKKERKPAGEESLEQKGRLLSGPLGSVGGQQPTGTGLETLDPLAPRLQYVSPILRRETSLHTS